MSTPGAVVLGRVDEVRAAWVRFVDSDARFLRWTSSTGDWPYIKAFVVAESTEAGELPDLLLHLTTRCTHPAAFLQGLAAEIHEVHAATAEQLELPPPAAAASLVAAVAAFLGAFGDDFVHLGLFLDPEEHEADAFQSACTELCTLPLPKQVRIATWDRGELGEDWAANPRVMSEFLRLRSETVPLEMAQSTAKPGVPGDAFRVAICKLTASLSDDDVKAAKSAHAEAVAIAKHQAWPILQAIAHASLAGGLVAQGSFLEGAKLYKLGFEALDGLSAEEAGKQRITCVFGQATAFLLAGKGKQAGDLYLEGAELEQVPVDYEGPDIPTIFRFDGFRLAAEAYRVGKERDLALRAVRQALNTYSTAAQVTQDVLSGEALVNTCTELAKNGSRDELKREVEAASLVWPTDDQKTEEATA